MQAETIVEPVIATPTNEARRLQSETECCLIAVHAEFDIAQSVNHKMRIDSFIRRRELQKGKHTCRTPSIRRTLASLHRSAGNNRQILRRPFRPLARVFSRREALPAKVKQIIAVAVAHVTQRPYCIKGHTKAALRHGASQEELMEAIWVAAEMRAGGAYAHSLLAIEEMRKAAKTTSA